MRRNFFSLQRRNQRGCHRFSISKLQEARRSLILEGFSSTPCLRLQLQTNKAPGYMTTAYVTHQAKPPTMERMGIPPDCREVWSIAPRSHVGDCAESMLFACILTLHHRQHTNALAITLRTADQRIIDPCLTCRFLALHCEPENNATGLPTTVECHVNRAPIDFGLD